MGGDRSGKPIQQAVDTFQDPAVGLREELVGIKEDGGQTGALGAYHVGPVVIANVERRSGSGTDPLQGDGKDARVRFLDPYLARGQDQVKVVPQIQLVQENVETLHAVAVGDQAQAISSGTKFCQSLAASVGAVIAQLQAIKPAGRFRSQVIQVTFDLECLKRMPVEVVPEFLGGEARQLVADGGIEKVLVTRPASLALGLGTEGLSDVGAEGADHVKAVWFVKNQGAVKVEKDGVDRVFCSHIFDVSMLDIGGLPPIRAGK